MSSEYNAWLGRMLNALIETTFSEVTLADVVQVFNASYATRPQVGIEPPKIDKKIIGAEREIFEKYIYSMYENMSFSRVVRVKDKYMDIETEAAWKAWQARARLEGTE